jgi:hypothetical protein
MIVQQLKELEKLGPKMKGIGDYLLLVTPDLSVFASHNEAFCPVSQSVKEVLQSLVDDNLVQMDKIGSSNCKVAAHQSFLDLSPNTLALAA